MAWWEVTGDILRGSFLSLLLFPGYREASIFDPPCPSIVMVCVTTNQRTTDPAYHILKPPKLRAKINPSPSLHLNYFYWVFVKLRRN
jgi:hypothetical protein